ncbi:hypothetical protein M885DRAFT_520395 [Pelagophyceae sp. CCMP2097]|nr:hypothetical protein M885DRAFT_520395 [Pelagophyceae sp. CCMP2097]
MFASAARSLSVRLDRGAGAAKRKGSLERICRRKTLTDDEVAKCRELMQAAADESAAGRRRVTEALILHSFEAECEWQTSVKAGDTVAVLDKLDDGWWLIDKSCGKGRGPFGCVPGVSCCWTLHDGEQPPPLPPRDPPAVRASSPAADTDKAQRSSEPELDGALQSPVRSLSVSPLRPPLPPRDPPAARASSPAVDADAELAQRSMEPELDGALQSPARSLSVSTLTDRYEQRRFLREVTPPPVAPSRPERAYTDADLEAAYAFLSELIHGNIGNASRLAPARFNELCLDPEFSRLVRDHADELRGSPNSF